MLNYLPVIPSIILKILYFYFQLNTLLFGLLSKQITYTVVAQRTNWALEMIMKKHRGYSRLLATKRSNQMDSWFKCKLYVKFKKNIINLKNFKMIDSVKNIKP